MTFLFAGSSGFSYKGRDLTSVHIELTKKFGFSDAHFDLAKVFLREAMTKLKVKPPVLEEVLDMIEKTRFLLLPESIYKPKDGTNANSETLLDRLGGPDALKELIDQFYDKLVEHDRTRHFFTGYDMNDQRERQVGGCRGESGRGVSGCLVCEEGSPCMPGVGGGGPCMPGGGGRACQGGGGCACHHKLPCHEVGRYMGADRLAE